MVRSFTTTVSDDASSIGHKHQTPKGVDSVQGCDKCCGVLVDNTGVEFVVDLKWALPECLIIVHLGLNSLLSIFLLNKLIDDVPFLIASLFLLSSKFLIISIPPPFPTLLFRAINLVGGLFGLSHAHIVGLLKRGPKIILLGRSERLIFIGHDLKSVDCLP